MFTAILIGVLLVLIGVAFTLFGYRLFVFLLPIWGFIVGFILGAQIISSIFGDGLLSTAIGWIVGFGIGIIVAILSYFIYSFGVYMLAATFGLGIGAILMYAIGIESNLLIAAVAIVAAVLMIVLVGYLDLKKWLIVFVTAFGGALSIISGVLVTFGTVSISEIQSGTNPVSTAVNDSILWILLWGALGIVGIVFQARTTKEFFQGEDYDYYHQLVAREQVELENEAVEKETEEEIEPSDDFDISDENVDLPVESSNSEFENKIDTQESLNDNSAGDIDSADESQQDDSIGEGDAEKS
jgi:hypothetical protein